MGKRVSSFLLLFLILGAAVSMLPNLGSYEFRMEESRRVLIAWEMVKRGEFLQPYFLGEPYFNKPPLFNWLILLSSSLLGWGELSLRLISLSFSCLSALTVCMFAYYLLKDAKLALLAGLTYLTFSDILFWYGWLGEIDAAFTFFILLGTVSLYLSFYKSTFLFWFAGLFTAGAFLLKGLPAYGFYLITFLAFLLHSKRYEVLKSVHSWGGALLSLLLPLTWLLLTHYPEEFAKRLFLESSARVEGSFNLWKLIWHLIAYPLLNLKQTLPASVVLIVILLKDRRLPTLPRELNPILLSLALNYLPYLFAAGSRGRYILPLFPLTALSLSPLVVQKERAYKLFLGLASVFILTRLIFGFSLTLIDEKRGSAKEAATRIVQLYGDKRIACDCEEIKSLCLYVSLIGDKYLRKSRYEERWEVNILCTEGTAEGRLLESFRLFGKEVKLVGRW